MGKAVLRGGVSTASSSFGFALGGPIGAAVAGALGDVVGGFLFPPDKITTHGQRLTDLDIQGASEGSAVSRVFGRSRSSGQIVWTGKLREEVSSTSRGGKGNPQKVEEISYRYYLTFAVVLCEGEMSHIGKVWADGEEVDLDDYSVRVYTGTEDQRRDSALPEDAPAYRGMAYAVFEDFPLTDFGNRIPNLNFEIVKPYGDNTENRVASINIRGGSEFGFSPTPLSRQVVVNGRLLPKAYTVENARGASQTTDWETSMSNMQSIFPNLESVYLEVAWFVQSPYLPFSRISPAVVSRTKSTFPRQWSVRGWNRESAQLLSSLDGVTLYGGTPDDQSVVDAILDLKRRGLKVGIKPVVFVNAPFSRDAGQIPPDSSAIVPTEEGTLATKTQIDAFFGNAQQGYALFVEHLANLAKRAGGVDYFLIGSRLGGMTRARAVES